MARFATLDLRVRLVPALIAVLAATAWGQANRADPHVGYVFPAGGQKGTSFEVIVGGQFLGRADGVYFSGAGVQGTVVKHYGPLLNVVKDHREEIRKRLTELIEKRVQELVREGHDLGPLGQEFLRGRGRGQPKKEGTEEEKPGELPDHPLLRNLETKSLRELLNVREELLNLRQMQPSRQVAETVLLNVTIDRTAAAGDREIRLSTPAGLTNPVCFQVGSLRETNEREINDPKPLAAFLPPEPAMELPVLVNGQIKPGDVDRIRFRARHGQQLAIDVQARHLVPFLADAVPGWFQATLALYDPKGREVAFADDFRFDPDPVLFYKVSEDGEYELEIHDALYRGREDFVYRVAVGEQGVITRSFPAISRPVTTTSPAVDGRNLPDGHLIPGADALPESSESEPNDAPAKAQTIELPRLVAGRIIKPGDVDVYRFTGRGGDEIVAEVYARRMNSPLDSLLRLTDASGQVLAWNDDHDDKSWGFITHHADSYIRVRLPADGVYFLSVSDVQHHGGPAYAYRLRISAPRPDFALRVTPSGVGARVGGSAPITIQVIRQDGFDGEIDVALEDAPPGFKLSGGRVPAASDKTNMTLIVPREPLSRPVSLRMEGSAQIAGQTVRRPVVPAEDSTQAFIYHHLTPAQELLAANTGPRRPVPPVEVASGRQRIPVGGSAVVKVKIDAGRIMRTAKFELRDAPEGVSLGAVKFLPDGVSLEIKAGEKAKPGVAGNLIVGVTAPPPGSQPAKLKPRQEQRASLGVLPAIPFEIVKR